jgi:hypothetical protein
MQDIKKLLTNYGILKPQPVSDWLGDGILPLAVAQFYAEVGPYGIMVHRNVGPIGVNILAGGNPVYVPPLCKLWELQVGYRIDGITGERIQNWPNEWLVIASESGNPFIFNSIDNQVYFDFSGAGGWQPKLLAPNIAIALGGLATLANALAELDDDEDYSEDFEMLPKARANCICQLVQFLGSEDKADAFIKTIEWYL